MNAPVASFGFRREFEHARTKRGRHAIGRTILNQRGRVRGFTLLEMLVVMVLLSLLMVGFAGALRTVGQAEERIDRRLAQADDFRVATSFLRSTLGQVSGQKAGEANQPGQFSVQFAGARDAIAWVGVMPARYGVGGRSFFRLAVETVASRAALVIRFVPWSDGPGFPDWSKAEARVLAAGVTAFSVRYEDGRPLPTVWQSEWPIADRTPDRVHLQLAIDAREWPALVIPLRVLPLGDPAQRGFVIGGTVG